MTEQTKSNDFKQALKSRLSFYELHETESEFPAIRKALQKHADAALDRFYEKVAATPETAHFFPERAKMDGAHAAQKAHWVKMFTDGLTEDYLTRATRIGHVHAHIGLDPQWYIGGYALILEYMIERMVGRGLLPGASGKTIAKLIKVALLDMDVALSTYFVKAEENVRTTVVNKIGAALADISDGNLTAKINDLPDSYGQLQSDFNSAIVKLRDTISAVTNGAQTISVGSSEIRAASDDLSLRTEQQAASLEESAAAMNQLTETIASTAKAIAGLNANVLQTHREAIAGGDVVKNAMSAMDGVQKSSDAIAQIIQIIDSIAFQTNLLALNAGVEAARVGEQGKGFAVVANEVRALAQRSSEAAEEIKQLITDSLGQVHNGVRLVHDAGKALETIVNQVGEISSVASGIAQSTEVQASNLQQINAAVADMDKMTQQNAAMVEESTAASRAMAGEAQRLSQMVAHFKVGEASHSPRRQKTFAVSGNTALAPESDENWEDF